MSVSVLFLPPRFQVLEPQAGLSKRAVGRSAILLAGVRAENWTGFGRQDGRHAFLKQIIGSALELFSGVEPKRQGVRASD